MENSEIINQMLAELLQKTIDKKINWIVVNANTIRWIKSGPPLSTSVTLQKQVSPNPSIKENYVMTIQSPPTPPTQFNTAKEEQLKMMLMKIYFEATKEAVRLEEEKKIDVIKNLLKDL